MKKAAMVTILLIVFGSFLYANGGNESTAYRGNGNGNGLGQQRGNGRGQGAGRQSEMRFTESLVDLLDGVSGGELSPAEVEGLVLMREEEKLARDVYASLYDIWNLPIFRNIGESEQQHMDALGILFEKYELTDPVAEDVPGKFVSPELTDLYVSLIESGKNSLVDALMVGATIEDLDIADLQKQLLSADNDDIRIVYQNLMKGSRNHLRSFVRFLSSEDKPYEAQYISDEYLQKILSLNREIEPISDPDYSI